MLLKLFCMLYKNLIKLVSRDQAIINWLQLE